MQTTGLHHLEKRTRAIARTPWVRVMDVVAIINGIFGSLTAVPQLYQIVSTRQAAGVSTLTWLLLTISSAIWLIYAIPHRSWPIIISSVLSIVLDVAVIIAVLMLR